MRKLFILLLISGGLFSLLHLLSQDWRADLILHTTDLFARQAARRAIPFDRLAFSGLLERLEDGNLKLMGRAAKAFADRDEATLKSIAARWELEMQPIVTQPEWKPFTGIFYPH